MQICARNRAADEQVGNPGLKTCVLYAQAPLSRRQIRQSRHGLLALVFAAVVIQHEPSIPPAASQVLRPA